MSIDLPTLRTYIKADQELAAWAATGMDKLIYQRLSAPHATAKVYRSVFINERTVLAAFANPADGEAVLQKLEAAGQSNAVIKRILRWMTPEQGGIDIGHASTRAMLAGLVQAQVLTQAEADTLTNLAASPSTEAIEELGEAVTLSDISAALKADRPDGRIQGA